MSIEVLRRSIFQNNDRAAQENRSLLDERGITAVNIMGGAGCGKTTLLEHLIPQLRSDFAVAVLEGDLATTKDAARIAALDVPVIQLLTEGGCHLTATLVQEALARLPLAEIDLLLIENVGNPICPANFDLGEHLRVAVLSVTEGDDKPAKYPFLFKVADQVVITKVDLIALTDFDRERALRAIHALDKEKGVLTVSKKDASSISQLADWLRSHVSTS
ncbi:MAG: hydrogenase nickel incorporation protein HypB [Phycisphaerales bacterium]|nr:MAG: hydrogenase nickel incorporation protein HypB [Phycisphaerales bacterium]